MITHKYIMGIPLSSETFQWGMYFSNCKWRIRLIPDQEEGTLQGIRCQQNVMGTIQLRIFQIHIQKSSIVR